MQTRKQPKKDYNDNKKFKEIFQQIADPNYVRQINLAKGKKNKRKLIN